jgi:hypothetical protein
LKDSISTLQKSAIGHNVPLVNNFSPLCESFVLHGNWWPTPYAKAMIDVKFRHDNIIIITHDGFKRATPVKKHTREITLFADEITINDKFAGSGQVHIQLLWQLHPTFTAFDAVALCISNGKQVIEIELNHGEAAPEIEYFHTHPNLGWYSPEYGSAKPNPVLAVTWIVNLPFAANVTFRARPCAA